MFFLSIASLLSHLTVLVPHDQIGTALNKLATTAQQDATLVGGTVFLVSVVIAGVMRMVAFGSERRIAISNMALTSAVVGLVIMLLATVLHTALTQILG
jgi:hypothetical protein